MKPDAAVTHRRVLTIALPIVLSNATVPLLGFVDTGVVGQMGEAAPIGAVGIGAILLTSIYWIFGFLRMGTTGLTAQALGAGEGDEVKALLSRGLLIGLGAGLLLALIQVPILAGGLWLSPASAEVEDLAGEYVAIRIWSAPAMIALYGINGWLIGQERTRAVLVLQLWMNGVNILLDLWFVLGLGWGVEGVAFATFLAEWSGLALGLWLCRAAFRGTAWRDRALVFARARWRRMVTVNGDIMIRSVLLQAIFTSFLLWSGGMGDEALAANQILMQFLQFTAYALDGFAFAVEALVGQAVGAGAVARFRRSVVLSFQWGAGVCLGLALVFWTAGGLIVEVLAESEAVQAEADHYLLWMVLAPILGCAAWMLDGVFIGATRTRDMRDMMVVSAAVYFIAVLPLMAAFANHGLWIALLISFVARGVTLGRRYPALERDIARMG